MIGQVQRSRVQRQRVLCVERRRTIVGRLTESDRALPERDGAQETGRRGRRRRRRGWRRIGRANVGRASVALIVQVAAHVQRGRVWLGQFGRIRCTLVGDARLHAEPLWPHRVILAIVVMAMGDRVPFVQFVVQPWRLARRLITVVVGGSVGGTAGGGPMTVGRRRAHAALEIGSVVVQVVAVHADHLDGRVHRRVHLQHRVVVVVVVEPLVGQLVVVRVIVVGHPIVGAIAVLRQVGGRVAANGVRERVSPQVTVAPEHFAACAALVRLVVGVRE